MNPALLSAIIALVQEAINLEPQIVVELQAIFSLPNPSPADWEALRQKVLGKSYSDYVPASALLAAAPVPAAVPPLAATGTTQSNAPISQPGASIPAYLPDGSKNPAHAA